ncbi:MAG: hypothetical protein H7338_08065, partial [Candidatus Sericytochromatia bacterium]|nr:hypothetical protein [Candidatus Sericytochromatia bacterium]
TGWSQPFKVGASPGIPSESPTLNWNGSILTAAWMEAHTLVFSPIVGPL